MNGRVRRRRAQPPQDHALAVSRPRTRFIGSGRLTEILLYVLLLSALVFGGGAIAANPRMLVISVIAAALLPIAFHADAAQLFGRLPLVARIAILLIAAMPLLQLIPLPPSIWSALPGRGAAAKIFELVGAQHDWHPLSLTPRNTAFSVLFLLPPLAAFFAALTLGEEARERCVIVLLGVVVLSILVGFIQLSTRGATLDFYSSTHRGYLLGFFANRNHQGLFIAVAAAFALALVQRKVPHRQGILAWSAILSITFIVAAIGSISRAGLGLTILSLALVHFAHFGQKLEPRRLILITAALFLGALAFYLLSFSSVVEHALTRFTRVGDDGRWEIWRLSTPLVSQYFPWGSGFGSFVPAFAAIEPLDSVSRLYLNHAHNDYLELLIEGGLPAMAVLGTIATVLAVRGLKVLLGSARLAAYGLPSAVGILMVALHSIVDYPMRTQSIMVLFGVMLAFFLADPTDGNEFVSNRRASTPSRKS